MKELHVWRGENQLWVEENLQPGHGHVYKGLLIHVLF